MRVGCIGLIVAIALIWGGGQGVYEAAVAGEKTDIAYRQLVKEMPTVGWYKVNGASWSLVDAITLRGSGGEIRPDLYIPVHANGAPAEGRPPAKLLVHVENQALADHMTKLIRLEPGDPRLLAASKTLFEEKPIEGTLEAGVNLDGNDQDALRKGLGKELADEYLVISQGKEPEGFGLGLIFLVAGLAIVALFIASLLRGGGSAARAE